CGAAVKNLAHSASFHCLENNAPSNPGIKHLVDYIGIYFERDGHGWILQFSTTQLGTNIAPGTYLNAEPASGASPGHAGIDVYGWGWPHAHSGSFTINEAVFDYSGPKPVVVSFS